MKLPENIVQFVKFGVVGVSNTAVSLVTYYVVLAINDEWYLFGNVAGWIISVANAFFWNNKFVFQNKMGNFHEILKRLGKTYLSYGATFILSTGLLYFEINVLQLSTIISPVLNLLVTIPLNFLLNKFWTFRET